VKNKHLVELGLKIKALRKSRNISQEGLAFKSGIDFSYLGKVERGENNPTYLTLCAIAEALDVSLLELFLLE
jgi:XRE family transcriptional regulator, regulator of sulfur utilization